MVPFLSTLAFLHAVCTCAGIKLSCPEDQSCIALTDQADSNNLKLLQTSYGKSIFTQPDATVEIDTSKSVQTQKALALGLLIPFVIVSYLAWHSWPDVGQKWVSRTWSEYGLVVMYVATSAGATLCMRQTKGSAATFTLEACLVLYLLKALISIVLLIGKQSTSLRDMVNALLYKGESSYAPVWCHLALLGTLLAGYDVFSFFARQRVTPVTFQLLVQSRSLLMIPLQWFILAKRITSWQFYAVLLIGVGACGLSFGDIIASGSSQDGKSVQYDYIVGIALIVGKILLSAVALVVNEKQLKELPLSVDAQNVINYSFGALFLGGGLCVWAFNESSNVAVQHEFVSVLMQLISHPWMLSAVLLMAVLGVVCAYLLKAYSAMEKEVFSSGVVAMLAVGQAFLPGDHVFGLWTIQSALIITFGTFVYCLNEPKPEPKPNPNEPSQSDARLDRQSCECKN